MAEPLTKEEQDQMLTWWMQQADSLPSQRFSGEHLSKTGLDMVERFLDTLAAVEQERDVLVSENEKLCERSGLWQKHIGAAHVCLTQDEYAALKGV